MTQLPHPQPLRNAQIELETVRWLWESTEEQLPTLIEATFQRILEQDPFYGNYTAEDIELNRETILPREREQIEAEMRRTARATTLIQAWVIFEDAARWSAGELRRREKNVGKQRPGETFVSWAARDLELFAIHPEQFRVGVLDWMEVLGRLRNILLHTNGRAEHMTASDRELVSQWATSKRGVELQAGQVDVSYSLVTMILNFILPPALYSLIAQFEQRDTELAQPSKGTISP
jgi:hypothetical protein